MYAYQFAKMQHVADLHGLTRFVSMQNHYNLVYREEEREMLPLCLEDGVGVIPWSPLARGFLTGNRTQDGGQTTRGRSDSFSQQMYRSDSDYAVQARLREVAERLDVPAAQVATAWLLAQPGVTAPIVGASKMPHLHDAVAALDVKLSPEDLKALEEPYEPHPVLGF